MLKESLEAGKIGNLEVENTSINGTAFAIVRIDPSRNGENATQPMLWTVIEKKSKPATGRIAGQISFPGESRKLGKNMPDTIAGGLFGEFSNDRSLIESHVFFTPSWFLANRLQIENKPFDLAILIFAGSLNQEINPLDTNEVAPNGFMTMEEIKRKDPQRDQGIVRGFVHQVVDLEISEGLIKRAVLEYERGLRRPISTILPKESYFPQQFFQDREKLKDILGQVA